MITKNGLSYSKQELSSMCKKLSHYVGIFQNINVLHFKRFHFYIKCVIMMSRLNLVHEKVLEQFYSLKLLH